MGIFIYLYNKDDDFVTDKELKKLSKLELLELLLTETRENEKLREELAKAKKENSIEKSAVLLNETVKQLDEVLRIASADGNFSIDVSGTAKRKKTTGKKPKIFDAFSKDILKSVSKSFSKAKGPKKSKVK